MINAYLNSVELKLFPDIAIGLTIENFNISDLSNRKIDRTNVIRVPKAGNEIAFQFASVPNAPTDFAYNDYDFDLVIDGMFIYENGRAFITGEDSDSYTLQVTNNKNIIDLLKSIELADLYTGDSITLFTTATITDIFKQKTLGFKIDTFYRLGAPTSANWDYVTAFSTISIYLDTILDKIEAEYPGEITFSGDLLTDADFLKMRAQCVQANIRNTPPSDDYILTDIIIHRSLTAWDLIKNILQSTCGVFKIDGVDFEIQKFNDLDYTTPLDWSGKLVSHTKKFAIPGIAQRNYIKYSIAEDVDEYAYAAVIECNNTNIDYEKDIAVMKAKIFPVKDVSPSYSNASTVPLWGIQLPNIKSPFPTSPSAVIPIGISAVNDLIIVVDSDEYLGQPIQVNLTHLSFGGGVWVLDITSGGLWNDADTTMVEFYNPSANYSLIQTMLTDPVFYEAELNLNILDINGFDPFKAVKIDELEGIFYVNKIVDFLATSPGTPTRVELIKIS